MNVRKRASLNEDMARKPLSILNRYCKSGGEVAFIPSQAAVGAPR